MVFIEETDRGEQDLIILEAAPERVERMLETWRGTAYAAQLLRELLGTARAADHAAKR